MPVKWGATPPWALSRAGEQAAAVDNEIGVGEPDIELPGFGGAKSGRHLTEGCLRIATVALDASAYGR